MNISAEIILGVITALGAILSGAVGKMWVWFNAELRECKDDRKSLNDRVEVMHRNIEELMKRGETLESLMARSEDLSGVSYDFYKRAKKNNQCCKLY